MDVLWGMDTRGGVFLVRQFDQISRAAALFLNYRTQFILRKPPCSPPVCTKDTLVKGRHPRVLYSGMYTRRVLSKAIL